MVFQSPLSNFKMLVKQTFPGIRACDCEGKCSYLNFFKHNLETDLGFLWCWVWREPEDVIRLGVVSASVCVCVKV